VPDPQKYKSKDELEDLWSGTGEGAMVEKGY